MTDSKIIYTHTDEAPAAGDVLLPADHPGLRRARPAWRSRPATSPSPGRIIAQFPRPARPRSSASTTRSPSSASWPRQPEANIIKLPNISASIPQLKAAIAELQEQGYDLPDYPDNPTTDEEKDVRARYDKVKGSAVNPVLREGNSDRRAPASVKQLRPQAPALDGRLDAGLEDQRRAHDRRRLPLQREVRGHRGRRHRCASSWSATTAPTTVLRESVPVLAGEVVDATVMRVAALREFLTAQIARAKADDVLFSVHLKATMMKVSDPIIFGHVVRAFFPTLFARVRRRARRRRAQPQRRPRRASSSGRRVAADERRRDQGRRRRRASPTARRWRWSTPTRASPTCTCRAT